MRNVTVRSSGSVAAILFLIVFIGTYTPGTACAMDEHTWSEQEKAVLRSLWIGSLGPLPVDPSNRYSDNPQAASFGRKLFFEDHFSGNMKVSCATCHREDYFFTDNLPLSHGMDTTPRRSMPLIGAAYNSWFFWDGRSDSLWSQALGPIENKLEHGISRTMSAYIISKYYREEYEALFGPIPEFTDGKWPHEARPAKDDPNALKAWVLMTPQQKEVVNSIYVNMDSVVVVPPGEFFIDSTGVDGLPNFPYANISQPLEVVTRIRNDGTSGLYNVGVSLLRGTTFLEDTVVTVPASGSTVVRFPRLAPGTAGNVLYTTRIDSARSQLTGLPVLPASPTRPCAPQIRQDPRIFPGHRRSAPGHIQPACPPPRPGRPRSGKPARRQ